MHRPPAARLFPAAALLLLLAGAGCQSGPRPAAEFVRQAQFLHDTSLRATAVRDPELSKYLGAVGKRIVVAAAAVSPDNTRDPTLANMQFHLVASDVVNAYGTGGGHIYLYDGLLQLCETEDELAALLAVQFAHALQLDVQRTGMRPDVTGNPDALAVSRVVYLFAAAPFSAAQCLAADRRAFEIYARGGWDPARFAEAYERMRARGLELPPSVGADGQPRPLLSARASAARALRSTLPPQAREWRRAPEADDVDGFKEVKAVARTAGRLANTADRGFLYLAAFPNAVLAAEQPKQQQAQGQLRRELTPPAPPTPKIEAS